MSSLTIRKYKNFEIHVVNGLYKYDIYNRGLWYNSVNSLNDAKALINELLWAYNV